MTVLADIQKFDTDLKKLHDKLTHGLQLFPASGHRILLQEIEEDFNEAFQPVVNTVLSRASVHIRELQSAVASVQETLEAMEVDVDIAKENLPPSLKIKGREFKRLLRLGNVENVEGTITRHALGKTKSLHLNDAGKIRPPVGLIEDSDDLVITKIGIISQNNSVFDIDGIAALLVMFD